MKILFAAFFASIILTFSAHSAEMTNGVFYASNPTECHLIVPSGATTTNQLASGTTYAVGEALAEMVVTNQTEFYFSCGIMIEAEQDSVFSINLFDQEILNEDSTPCKAKFGTYNLSLMLNKGEFSIICHHNDDTNSSFTVSTAYSSYELTGGKYYFRVSSNSVVAYVLEGTMLVHDDKDHVNKTDNGKIAVAMPFIDPLSGIGDKIITSIKPLKADEVAHLSAPVLSAAKKTDNVQFFIVGHQVIGIRMK